MTATHNINKEVIPTLFRGLSYIVRQLHYHDLTKMERSEFMEYKLKIEKKLKEAGYS